MARFCTAHALAGGDLSVQVCASRVPGSICIADRGVSAVSGRYSLTAAHEASKLSYLVQPAHRLETSLLRDLCRSPLSRASNGLSRPCDGPQGELHTFQIFFDERTWNVL